MILWRAVNKNNLLLTPVRQRVADVAMFTRLAQTCRMPLQRTESAKTILKWFGYLRLLTLDGLNIHRSLFTIWTNVADRAAVATARYLHSYATDTLTRVHKSSHKFNE